LAGRPAKPSAGQESRNARRAIVWVQSVWWAPGPLLSSSALCARLWGHVAAANAVAAISDATDLVSDPSTRPSQRDGPHAGVRHGPPSPGLPLIWILRAGDPTPTRRRPTARPQGTFSIGEESIVAYDPSGNGPYCKVAGGIDASLCYVCIRAVAARRE
jgi:hypothetical protein